MFERISWLTEILNVVLCLHFLYGQRVKSKAATGILIVADWFVMEVITQYSLSRISICIIYILVWVYTIAEFGRGIKKAVLANVIWIIVLGLLQLVSSIPWVIVGTVEMSDLGVVLIQIETMAVICVFHKGLGKLFQSLLHTGIVTGGVIAVFLCYIVMQIIKYRRHQVIDAEQFLPVIIFGVLVSILAYGWQKEREKREQKELEMRISQLCEGSFRELIDTIRMKQHDFYNHIHTLQCLHYTAGNYEDLVKEQERYCADIKYDNRYYSLLNTESPVISGFLYGKFMEADKYGIKIDYEVILNRMIKFVPEYIIVEIIGILWDNALDYVKQITVKKIKVYIQETKTDLKIVIQNPIVNITYKEIEHFCQNGYSGKKGHDGIGLNKIGRYAEYYRLNFVIEKIHEDQIDWLKTMIVIQGAVGK